MGISDNLNLCPLKHCHRILGDIGCRNLLLCCVGNSSICLYLGHTDLNDHCIHMVHTSRSMDGLTPRGVCNLLHNAHMKSQNSLLHTDTVQLLMPFQLQLHSTGHLILRNHQFLSCTKLQHSGMMTR